MVGLSLPFCAQPAPAAQQRDAAAESTEIPDQTPDAPEVTGTRDVPATGLAADATSPIIATDTGWSAPFSRIGGDDKALVTATEPAAFGLTLPRGLRPATLTIDHYDTLGPASKVRVQVILDDTIVGSTEIGGAGALSINLADFVPKTRAGETTFVLRMTPTEVANGGACTETLLSLAGIRMNFDGTAIPGRTIAQVFPSDLERLVLVTPTANDHARTALARLAVAMTHQESPRIAVDVIDESMVKTFAANANPWTRIVHIRTSREEARFDVVDAQHVTLYGDGKELTTLAALIGESELRNAELASLRATSAKIPQIARPQGSLRINVFPRNQSTANGRGEAELASVLDSAELGLRFGSIQGSLRGFVQLDRPVSGVTVTAQLSGRTLATTQLEGRSGSYAFNFAAYNLEGLASHQLEIKATSGERSDDATCPGTLASVQLSIDPGSFVTLTPANEIPASISSYPWAAGTQPRVVLNSPDAERLHLVVSELIALQRNRRSQMYPVISAQAPARRANESFMIVAENRKAEAAVKPSIAVQPLRLSSQALGGTANTADEFTSVSMSASTKEALGDLIISSPSPSTARSAGNTLQRLVDGWPGSESFGYLIAADELEEIPSNMVVAPIELTNAPVTPNELGLGAPEAPTSSRNTLIVGLIIGAMAALALRIIVRTHRAASNAVPMVIDTPDAEPAGKD
jgi:hypothetical protein